MDKRFWERLIFQGISEESKKSIENMRGRRESVYQANELVLKEGEEIKDICVILEGVLKSTEYTPSGKELNSSYFFGREMSSAYYTGAEAFPFYLVYSGESRYFFNTFAFKKSKVIWLPIDELMPIIDSDKVFMKNILIFVSSYTRYSKRILRLLKYRRIDERLSYWILYLNKCDGRIEIPVSQEVLADILNVSRTSLNQELIKMKDLGVIDMDKKFIKVLNKDYLESLV